jgi:hypothetical protein
MEKALLILIVSIFFSCNTSSKLFKEYSLYQRDKNINYPKEKLTIKFSSDSTGLFINRSNEGEEFQQSFSFLRVESDYLVIESITPENFSFISIKKGDTIVVTNKQLHFFYKGDQKYLLSFKRVL